MKLGKALAKGVAEERPESYESGEPVDGEREIGVEIQETATAAAEEVPVAR
ncbi:hypothetical protein [Streptomyces ipomoeae]|uniref:hypothetical protein n=1 Tax=Streptomyces ipomoeae TaxID=103232 RepID=UPI0015F10B7D|nr:hypothetical protein [Streptomyces ipomoeae]MDX2931116.1 hypothetical protein [Streptomyces ipomoeae]